MKHLEDRLNVHRLHYWCYFVAGFILLGFLMNALRADSSPEVGYVLILLGMIVGMHRDAAQLIKKQNDRLETLEAQLARLEAPAVSARD